MMTKHLVMGFVLIVLFASNSYGEPIVFIVNKDNPIASISNSGIQKIFLKKIKRWDSGEKTVPINLYNNTLVKRDFVSSILGMILHEYDQYWLGVKQRTGETEPRVVKSSKFVLKIVSVNKEAIGYLPEKYFNKLGRSSREKIKVVGIAR